MMRVLQSAALLALTSLALAGCGGDGGDGGGVGGGGGSGGIDGCAIVTQEDATALFGLEATLDPAGKTSGMAGHCKWEAENADGDSHSLTFSVWESEGYYSLPATADTQPYAIGETGHIRSAEVYGVSIMWIQNGLVPDLYYFTLGPSGASTPEASTKVEQMKTLAQKVSTALP
jgi:hypothetical protein